MYCCHPWASPQKRGFSFSLKPLLLREQVLDSWHHFVSTFDCRLMYSSKFICSISVKVFAKNSICLSLSSAKFFVRIDASKALYRAAAYLNAIPISPGPTVLDISLASSINLSALPYNALSLLWFVSSLFSY